MMEKKDQNTRVKFDQIFDTIDLKTRKTKIICTMGYSSILNLTFLQTLLLGRGHASEDARRRHGCVQT